ncbi:MAG: alpha-amylase/4-alpha-glucanotransferase domain-containing protein [Endomicrobiia bacterium]
MKHEMKKINLLIGVHNHQPVGNFFSVFEEAYFKAYKPFIEIIDRYPSIKWTLHCTGVLWDYLKEHHLEYIKLVRSMIERNQLELLTGGYYEPILPVLSDKDKIGQIKKMNEFLKSEFGIMPRGMWLAERVWEPHLIKVISELGIEYVLLDDYHFVSVGINEDELTGYYITEEQGYSLKIFPISQKLRYYIPWRPVKEGIEYLLNKAEPSGQKFLVLADDGEKFGLWPETYKLIYTEGYLEKFLTEIEKNSDCINTLTFSEIIDNFSAKGRVYLPTSSYFEMTQWALPQSSQTELEEVLSDIEKLSSKEKIRKFLHGTFWRNFLVKYPESNNMHKKMLYVSNKIGQISSKIGKQISRKKSSIDNALVLKALDYLYKGQCNCAYWHGVFGGLYLPHLRNAIYQNLISAENLIDKPKKMKINIFDFDFDSKNEVIVETEYQNLYISPHNGGSIFEWDIRNKGINILNVLTRRKEAYHSKMIKLLELKRKNKDVSSSGEELGLWMIKDESLDRYLCYDWYRRATLLDHFLHPDTKYNDFGRCQFGEQGDFVLGEYQFVKDKTNLKLSREGIVWVKDERVPIKIEKSIKLLEKSGIFVFYKISTSLEKKVNLIFAPEMNFSFSYFKEEDIFEGRTKIWSRGDDTFKIKLNIEFSEEHTLWTFPIETVSLSEGGFEKTYQGICVLPLFYFEIDNGLPYEFSFKIEINEF